MKILYKAKTSLLVQHAINGGICFDGFLSTKVRLEGQQEEGNTMNQNQTMMTWMHGRLIVQTYAKHYFFVSYF